MDVKEKILLVQLLLEDIRGNWGCGWVGKDAIERATKAKELCEEIANELRDDHYLTLAHSCDGYVHCYYYDGDGRWFRAPFPSGYEDMDTLHGLEETFLDKSDEFRSIAEEYLTYPEYRFKDWEKRFDD